MVASPLSFPYSLRRNRKEKESFKINVAGEESDTSACSTRSNEPVIDEVFCSVHNPKQLHTCCSTRGNAISWIVAGVIIFILPFIVLPSVVHRVAHNAETSPQTIEEKVELPQSSLLDKIIGPSLIRPSYLPTNGPSSSPPTASPSIDQNQTSISNSTNESTRATISPSLSRMTIAPAPTRAPSIHSATSKTPTASLIVDDAISTQNQNSTSFVPSATVVSNTFSPTRFGTKPRDSFNQSSSPSSDANTSDEAPSQPNLRLPSLNSIAIPIGVPVTSPVAAPSPVSIPRTTLRVNCGGDQLVSSTPLGQQFWIPDRFYTYTGAFWQNNTCDDTEDSKGEDKTWQLYCTARKDVQSYSIPVTNGDYAVSFHFLLGENTLNRSFSILGTPIVVDRPRQIILLKTSVNDSLLQIPIEKTSSGDSVLLAAFEIEPYNAQQHRQPLPSAATVTPSENDIPLGNVTYSPGSLTTHQRGLVLSRGLNARAIATSGHRILYRNGTESRKRFHKLPDAGATYPDTRPGNEGGWIYVSNSEMKPTTTGHGPGGVGAITFDRDGLIIDYRMVLTGTRMNCGGGRTPWGAWISGEEFPDTGHIWQVDPTGERKAERITMGETNPGLFESFAFDTRDPQRPWFFMTQDHKSGALRRFSPDNPNWDDPWTMLLGNGTLEYLVVEPEEANAGTFRWSPHFDEGSNSSYLHFQNSEGIDVNGHHLYFVSKTFRTIFILDLDAGTYVNETTTNGLFNGQPDQIERVNENDPTGQDHLVYFTEDGGRLAGVHARNSKGQYLTVLESAEYSDETTGLSFSPDGKHMLVAYQETGVLFDVTRDDGLSFHAETLDVKFHAPSD